MESWAEQDARALEPTVHALCPYCGQSVEPRVETLGPPEESYVEDCPVCCQPWHVHILRTSDDVWVELFRADS